MTALHPLARKMHLKPGHRALVLNAPPNYLATFTPLPEGVEAHDQPDGVYDWVQLLVRNKAELDHWFATAQAAVKYDALLWICYPKGGTKAGTDLNRDSLWELVNAHGLNVVTQVAIDDQWSALRFRPPERVGH